MKTAGVYELLGQPSYMYILQLHCPNLFYVNIWLIHV